VSSLADDSGNGSGIAAVAAANRRVHLIDGTYELFRQYFGQPPKASAGGAEVRAALGVVGSLFSMIERGATHIGVATDHVIESFRNELWSKYKTGAGVPQNLLDQFEILELLIEAAGIKLWAMVELEADDAMASAATVAGSDPEVGQILLCTPDKDLAQCVVGERVVQLDRRTGTTIDEAGVWAKFGVAPESIPDWLALVGDNADGFPGLEGWGKRSASVVLARYGHIDAIPDDVSKWDEEVRGSIRGAPRLAERLAGNRELAALFLDLATLRSNEPLLSGVEELRWRGPGPAFAEVCRELKAENLSDRAEAALEVQQRR
jgi:5'-3' exonuclease